MERWIVLLCLLWGVIMLNSCSSHTAGLGYLPPSGNHVELRFEVKNGLTNELVDECQLVIMRDSLLFAKTSITDQGFFAALPFDSRYSVTVGSEGLGARSIIIDTKIPDHEREGGFVITGAWPLLPYYPDIDNTILSIPMAIAHYEEDRRNIVFDEEYVDSIQPQWEEYKRSVLERLSDSDK